LAATAKASAIEGFCVLTGHPALAWAALAAAALVALEMRLAVQPAETPAA